MAGKRDTSRRTEPVAFGLSEPILEDLRRLFRQFPEVEKVLIYGSRARGDFKPYSDIDLAVIAPSMSSERFAALFSALEDLPILFRIDLVHLDRLANGELKEEILRQGKVLYQRQDA